MNNNLIIQYIIVAVIIISAFAWCIVRIIRIKKGKASACSSCSISASCSKAKHLHSNKKCGKPDSECHCNNK